MYGTVARVRLKPGAKEQLLALAREFEKAEVPGWVDWYIYQSDEDPNVYYMAVAFESRADYAMNADSPEQEHRYQQLRALMEEDPEWHDGQIVWARGLTWELPGAN